MSKLSGPVAAGVAPSGSNLDVASREPRAWSRARPRVAFVGGIDRIERQIVAFGEQLGVDVEVHAGRTSGSSTDRIAALVHRTDLVVIVTGTNSHNAVRIAKREAAKARVATHIVTFCGAATARALLSRIAVGGRCGLAAPYL